MAPSEVSKDQWLPCSIKHIQVYLPTQLTVLDFSELNSIVSSFYLDC